MATIRRRAFLKRAGGCVGAGVVVGGVVGLGEGLFAAEGGGGERARRVTLAQIKVGRVVEENMRAVRRAFEAARRDDAGWVLFPEGTVSGYWGGFKQAEVAEAFEEVAELTAKARVTALVGTSWRAMDGRLFNQLRILGPDGRTVGAYGKKVLTYGDAKWATAGESALVFEVGGERFGTLICNDLWVTPGFCDGPDPRLTLAQSRGGARVIFHAISSGGNQKYREYHESNLKVRAAEARCPIVAVNAFPGTSVNATSGVIGTRFEYEAELPRDREAIQTVSFTPGGRV